MPLHVLPAPAPALRSVLAALSSPSAALEDRPLALRSVQGPVSPESPLPVHVLDVLDDLGAPDGLGALDGLDGLAGLDAPDRAGPDGSGLRTRLTGWRFLLRGDGATVAAAETVLAPDGWTFSHFFEGPYLGSTELALRRAESSVTRYQPRLLSVPALYMLTLWLHADPDADASAATLTPADLLVPLAPAPPGITAHRPYRVGELLPVISLRLSPAPLLGSPA
ncbi:hypothetical protein [Streptomyces qinzhouensis]|uniref:hypothetical protein n=1 Tax=Streptomyces qinzhouensis TaxID=2599401 RepID=UPI001646ECBE|nr:hypothetical protein [Streptomyces qinzhouensis]